MDRPRHRPNSLKLVLLLASSLFVLAAAREAVGQATGVHRVDSHEDFDWLIVAGERFGAVEPGSSEVDLVTRLGGENVRPDSIGVGEGYCVPGTVLFGGTANEVEIIWVDSSRTAPAIVRVWRNLDVRSDWMTSEGIYPGIPLSGLVEINGGPLTFSGFGWDYGGGVGSAEGGALAPSFNKGLQLALTTDRDSISALSGEENAGEIFGDRIVRSDHPLVQRAGVTVTLIALRFARPDYGAEVFCG